MKSPTQRTMERMRAEGFLVCKAEYWNPFPKPHGQRHDLFCFVDVIQLAEKIIAIQCTSYANIGSRCKKIRDIHAARMWLIAGGLIVVHGWRKRGRFWQCSVRRAELIEGCIRFVKCD